ncbi:MAG: NDP-sugar synthase [Methanophagales archaeon ANME-1-THS]|nr:MAG: NDP-sugar synthase [Methanophagales archaeon ANME-1-THS]
MVKAVILAGGFGTRLRPLTFTTPKALLPLVNRPVIDYILDYLAGFGLKDIVITTNYLREPLIEYLSTRKELKITYPEEPSPLGTAGSVKNAGITEPMVVIQGDNITDIDISTLMKVHKAHAGLVTIALLPVSNPSLYGIAELDPNGKIRAFREKPPRDECFSNLANTGLYILEPEALAYVPEGCSFDFSKNLFPLLVAKNEVYGCVVRGFWADVGGLEGYMEASRWILEKKGFECADTAEVNGSDIQGNVAIGDYAKVESSLIRGPAVIGDHATLMKSKMYKSVIFPRVILDGAMLHNTVICEDALIKNAEITDSIIGPRSEIKACLRKGETPAF